MMRPMPPTVREGIIRGGTYRKEKGVFFEPKKGLMVAGGTKSALSLAFNVVSHRKSIAANLQPSRTFVTRRAIVFWAYQGVFIRGAF